MAFRVPQQHKSLQSPTTERPQPSFQQTPNKTTNKFAGTDSEEWVVFSPSSVDAQTTRTLTSGLVSHQSDLESLDYGHDEEDEEDDEEEEILEDAEEEDDEDDDNDIDLMGFRDPYHQGPVMLPAHDGLGTFPSQSPPQAFDHPMQASPPSMVNSFANSRIQAWRMEQSRILLDEIEKVTRGRLAQKMTETNRLDEEQFTLSHVGLPESAETDAEDATLDRETLWKRLTRRVFQDVLGFDDMVLQVIFGEALPDMDDVSPGSSPTNKTNLDNVHPLRKVDNRWEDHFLERLARELGVLVKSYTQHPATSAFSTYNRHNTIFEDSRLAPRPEQDTFDKEYTSQTPKKLAQSTSSIRNAQSTELLSSAKPFEPTLRDELASHAENWGIEDRPKQSTSDPRLEAEAVREYWEKELNVRMLFSFLKTRFSSSHASPAATVTSTPTRPSTGRRQSNTSSIRTSQSNYTPSHHHHPLIQPRPSFSGSISSALGLGFGVGGIGGSSCASESTKKSGTKRSVGVTGPQKKRSLSSPSRHYWEVATSAGSGRSSACVGVGAWGEV